MNEKLSSGERAKRLYRRNIDKIPLLCAIVVIVVILSFLSEYFFTWSNLGKVTRQISTNVVLTVGMALVVITGGIDLSVGAIIAMSNCVMAKCMAEYGINPILSVVIGLLIGVLCGAFNGLLIAKGNIPPFIATLGTQMIVRGLAYVYTEAYPVSGVPTSFNIIGEGDFLFLPIPLWILTVAVIFGSILLNRTVLGNHIYAVGNNQESARLAGINISKTLIKVYTLSGLMCGVAAVIFTSRLVSGQPTMAMNAEMDAISASVLGGLSLSGGCGTISGALLGAIIIGLIANGMNMLHVSAYYQLIVKGAVLLLAIGINSLRQKKESK